MLFAYNEDGTLEVVADEAEARIHFESYDVESGAVRLFDGSGNPLSPRFPHRSERKILGIRISDDPGPFELVASEGTGETLLQALSPAVVLMPNRWFKDIDAVRARLAGP